MAPRPVTIRTFDIDERQLARPLVDAALDARWFPDQPRSGHAGLRGIRFGLAQPAIFKTQLRALLRAATHGPRAGHVSVRLLAAGSSSGEGAAR